MTGEIRNWKYLFYQLTENANDTELMLTIFNECEIILSNNSSCYLVKNNIFSGYRIDSVTGLCIDTIIGKICYCNETMVTHGQICEPGIYIIIFNCKCCSFLVCYCCLCYYFCNDIGMISIIE